MKHLLFFFSNSTFWWSQFDINSNKNIFIANWFISCKGIKHGFKQITSKLHNQVSGHTDGKKSPGRSHIRIEHHSNLTQTQTNRSKKKKKIKLKHSFLLIAIGRSAAERNYLCSLSSIWCVYMQNDWGFKKRNISNSKASKCGQNISKH